MTALLEGLSSGARLQAERAAREPIEGGWHCRAFGDTLSPGACQSRIRELLRTGGMRRHLCDGHTCPHYESPKRPARRAPAQTSTPAVPEPTEGDPMTTPEPEPAREPQPEAQHPHRYGDRPLPEGARVSARGAVYVNRTQMVPCPFCPDGWKMANNHRCRACWDRERQNQAGPAPTPATDAAALKSLKRLRKQLEAKEQRAKARPEPAPEPKRPRGRRVPLLLAAPPTPLRAGDQAVTEAVQAARKPATTALNAEDPAMMRGAAPDLINQPPHYIAGNIQCIDVIRALGFDFEEGSALKYLFRHTRKGAPLQDLRKCRFYVDALIARYEAGTP